MSDVAAQFFSPWDPPPPFASPPTDAKRADVLHKLAEYAVKNGATFVELIKDKQKDNPEYQFLFGGQDSDYYRWVLYCRCHNLPSDQPPQPQSLPLQNAHVQTQDIEVALQQTLATSTPEVRDGFLQVLAALSGSKESIKQSQQWFMACLPYAPAMAAALALHVRNLPDYDKQLHVLYLANDILLKRLSQRPPGSAADADEVAQAFKPWLPGVLGMAFSTGGRTDQVKERLLKILTFWADRKLYDKDTMQQLEAALLSGDPNAMLQAPAPKPAARAGKRKWDQPAPAASDKAANMAPIAAQPLQPAVQQASPVPVAYPPPQLSAPQPPYQDPQMQQQGYSQPYQQHPGSMGMQSMASGSFGMPNANIGTPGNAPWQAHTAQQQPWGMGAQAPGFNQYPQSGMGSLPLSHQMPGMLPGQNYMPQIQQQMQQQQQLQQQPQHQQPQQQQLHLPPQAQHQAGTGPGGPAWFPPPGVGMQGMPGSAPGHFPKMALPPDMHAPPPDLAQAAAAQAVKPKKDPMSFPPGLIPQLVAEKLKTDPPYSPLSPLDIDRAGLPPTLEPDSYLKSRIDRFFAELQDWRPGVHRTDGGKPRKAGKDGAVEEARTPFDAKAETPTMPSDGSFQGSGGLGFANAGLGFNSVAEERPVNAFDSYREQRSGRYKSSLAKPPPTSFS